eukprot:7483767-Heterocapsa_arctica.AAC.1
MAHLFDRSIHALRSGVHVGCRFVSSAKWEPLDEALQSLSAGTATEGGDRRPRLRASAKQDLLASHLWLLNFLDEQHK